MLMSCQCCIFFLYPVGAELGDLPAELPLREGEEPASAHPIPRLPGRELQVEAPQSALQLVPADLAVVVRVELPQPRP